MLKFIGDTPFTRSNVLSATYGCHIYIKADFHHPGMSSKDRTAYYMVRDAEQKEQLRPGDILVEASSGNTGLGLAILARANGYKCHIFVSSKCASEKIKLLQLQGAQITVCPNSNGPADAASTQSQALAFACSHPDAFFCNQYFNQSNLRAHYETTGPEIWQQSEKQVTHFIAGVGTGGTISGVGRYLKEQNPKVQIWGVDPVGSILSHYFYHGKILEKPGKYEIEGIGRNFIPGSLDCNIIDRFIQVNTHESVLAAYEFKKLTGFLSGFSSAAVLAALERAKQQRLFSPEDVVVLFFADHGSRYMSKLYNAQWLEKELGISLEEDTKEVI